MEGLGGGEGIPTQGVYVTCWRFPRREGCADAKMRFSGEVASLWMSLEGIGAEAEKIGIMSLVRGRGGFWFGSWGCCFMGSVFCGGGVFWKLWMGRDRLRTQRKGLIRVDRLR